MQDLESRLTEFLSTPARQARVVEETGHRPWPLPDAPWVQAQTWEKLLFAHWRVPIDELRQHVPEELPLDTFDGSAWIGITPFKVSGLRVRGVPPLPYLSAFLELNVRTYVELDGKAGIYFFSLDAESALAVEAARRLYRLPYLRARMSAGAAGEEIDYASERTEGRRATFRGRYGPVDDPAPPPPGSLEHFLTERYCLYTLDDDRRVQRGEIHHPPWPLQPAKAEIDRNTMGTEIGLALDGPPLLHYAGRQDVVFWRLAPAG